MGQQIDLTRLRYLREVGWFVRHEKCLADMGRSYDTERLTNSRRLLEEVLGLAGLTEPWLKNATVISIGPGCTGDLATWPCAVKIAVDPLLGVYRALGMLLPDQAGVSPTTFIDLPAESIPLLDECADLVVCRNALDHMLKPDVALDEIGRVLRPDGLFFLSVDIGGAPTPDEPSPFSAASLGTLLQRRFVIRGEHARQAPHSTRRLYSLRIVAAKRRTEPKQLDKSEILKTYFASSPADEARTAAATSSCGMQTTD